jgi:hypothetical protein
MRLLVICLVFSFAAKAQEPLYDDVVFSNSRMPGNYFFSRTASQPPSVIKNEKGKLPVSEKEFFTPGNALLLDYVNAEKGNWSAIVYKPGLRGQDRFREAKFLSFHLCDPSGKTRPEYFPSVQLMSRDSSLSKKIRIIPKQAASWKQVIIPLVQFGNMNSGPSDIIAVVFSQQAKEGGRHILYIDDIEFLSSDTAQQIRTVPAIRKIKGYAKHVWLEWEPVTDPEIKYVKIYRSENVGTEFDRPHRSKPVRSENKGSFLPVGIQSTFTTSYSDYTGETGKTYRYKISFVDRLYRESPLSQPSSASTRAMNDEELMTMVQEACFRYYWDGAEKNSGLAKENIPGRQNMIATGASGFGIMALIVGTERKFITRAAAVGRFTRLVNFLEKAESFHGVFPHFIDGPTGKVEPFFGRRDNGGDLVETSFLIQGLLAARAYFDQDNSEERFIRDRITEIWKKVEWDWYRQFPDSKFLYWHWSPDQAWVINHRLIGWNETMVTYLLAIASPTHSVPASMYYSGWANQDSTGQQYRSAWGGTREGSMYTNGNTYFGVKLDVGVSNGGPLFFTHYSFLAYDPHLITDRYTNYFDNNRNIALINYRYCMKNPGNYKGYGDSGWGLTASDGPYHYSADEPVVSRDKGKIAPTGALSSFPYLPDAAMKALKNYYNNYGKFLWGEYGFRDAFDLTENWCSEIYMGLNQAPMVVMIENYRTGLLWKLLMRDQDVQNGLKKLDQETTKYK